ncbi:hypothetical protein XELAEV_18028318mg [Xenopus laevis]|uniref:BHLH domain-containing protein n=1 Tax=Xenopus laevis TaxID=8355 RepID=A0A974HKW5_XENLA|nr:hypothetical protein XELAEV_18028318mg [Xenopus laevis]
MEGTVAGEGDGLQGWSMCSCLPSTSTEDRTGRVNQWKPTQIATFKRQKLPSTKSVTCNSETYKAEKQCPENAARERGRVRTLRQAFLSLQAALPSVPPNTKLSKLDVLVLATSYIAHLTHTLDQDRGGHDSSLISRGPGYLHPMKNHLHLLIRFVGLWFSIRSMCVPCNPNTSVWNINLIQEHHSSQLHQCPQ